MTANLDENAWLNEPTLTVGTPKTDATTANLDFTPSPNDPTKTADERKTDAITAKPDLTAAKYFRVPIFDRS